MTPTSTRERIARIIASRFQLGDDNPSDLRYWEAAEDILSGAPFVEEKGLGSDVASERGIDAAIGPPRDEWQPIYSAPRETRFLAWDSYDQQVDIVRMDGLRRLYNDAGQFIDGPGVTHWLPLPSPLSSGSEATTASPDSGATSVADATLSDADVEAGLVIIGMLRESAERVTGGNCAFADDDLAILEHLAQRAVVAGLTDGLHPDVAAKALAACGSDSDQEKSVASAPSLNQDPTPSPPVASETGDLVKRLRGFWAHSRWTPDPYGLAREAADEITRLRALPHD